MSLSSCSSPIWATRDHDRGNRSCLDSGSIESMSRSVTKAGAGSANGDKLRGKPGRQVQPKSCKTIISPPSPKGKGGVSLKIGIHLHFILHRNQLEAQLVPIFLPTGMKSGNGLNFRLPQV